MSKQHIDEQHDGGYWIAGTRVSLDSVVYAFLNGLSAENIVECFPTLTLEQVNSAYYQANREAIDSYLRESEAGFIALRKQSRTANALLFKKLEDARCQSET